MRNKTPPRNRRFSSHNAVIMPFAKPSSLLLFALLTSTSSTLSILQPANPAVVTVGNNTVKGDLHCHPDYPFVFGRPRAQDCICAIRRLSSSHIHGTFHSSMTGDDPFGLPVSKTCGLCEVLVQLRSLRTEDGTWLGLNLAATQLVTACTDREGFLPKRGGWTDAGDHDMIRITVQSSKQAFDVSGS